MREQIRWDYAGPGERRAVVELCKWVTGKGNITKRGLEIAKTSWNNLTPAARTVLERHGITR